MAPSSSLHLLHGFLQAKTHLISGIKTSKIIRYCDYCCTCHSYNYLSGAIGILIDWSRSVFVWTRLFFRGGSIFFPLTICVFIICYKFFSLMAPNIRCGCHIWQGVISLGVSRPPPPSSHLGNKGDLGCGSAGSCSGGYSPGWDPVPHLSPLGGFVGPGVIWLGGACIFPSPPLFTPGQRGWRGLWSQPGHVGRGRPLCLDFAPPSPPWVGWWG